MSDSLTEPRGMEIEVLDPNESTLGELASIANQEHTLTCHALSSAVLHAIRCGEAVLEARGKFPENETTWKEWVSENLTFNVSTASRYVRLAYYRDQHARGYC